MISEVPDEENSVGFRGCEESGGFFKKTSYKKTATIQLSYICELWIVKKRVSGGSAIVKRRLYV
jgi:hypothetical protein